MSKKPPKKSDLNKAWMRAGKTKRIALAPEYHLIVTEGTRTEPLYFQELCRIVNEKYRDRLFLEVSGEGDNTENLFQKARKLVKSGGTVYKHVWLVYDKDDFPADHFDHTAVLCQTSSDSETIWHALWSNQCIELWFLLHFMFLQADLHRDEYWQKLNECLKSVSKGTYYKNRADMYRVLRPYLDDAIRNAGQLQEINKGKLPSQSSPGTMVHTLFEKLYPYL